MISKMYNKAAAKRKLFNSPYLLEQQTFPASMGIITQLQENLCCDSLPAISCLEGIRLILWKNVLIPVSSKLENYHDWKINGFT